MTFQDRKDAGRVLAQAIRASRDWVDAIVRLHDDEQAWNAMSRNARQLMKDNYSFATGIDLMREAFLAANIY